MDKDVKHYNLYSLHIKVKIIQSIKIYFEDQLRLDKSVKMAYIIEYFSTVQLCLCQLSHFTITYLHKSKIIHLQKDL